MLDLKETIYKRKSIRKYKKEMLSNEEINELLEFISSIKPLYEDIKVKFEIVEKEKVKSIFSWLSEQILVAYSEEKEGYNENIGFIMQQIDLYLQSKGIGSCWIGLGKADSAYIDNNDSKLKFVIMMTLGYPNEEFRKDISEFKRNKLSEISDLEDERLEVARLAPSSINNQPWYFVHEENKIHTYVARRNIFYKRAIENLLLIDTGIALAHIYVANKDNFKFYKEMEIKEIKGYNYLGSFTLD